MGTLWLRQFQNVKNCQVSCCYVVAVHGRGTQFAACWQLKVPLGCAPGCFAEYQELLTILPKPPPGYASPLSRLFFVKCCENKSDIVCIVGCSVSEAQITESIFQICSKVNSSNQSVCYEQKQHPLFPPSPRCRQSTMHLVSPPSSALR